MELTLRGNNLYRNGRILKFADGQGLIERDTLEFKGTIEDSYYKVKTNDRIDLIAHKFYSSRVEDASKYWWVIADANVIENPLDLSAFVGKEILIPNILNVLLELQD